MDGIRRLSRRAAVVAAAIMAGLAVLLGPSPAWARADPPPDIRGLSVADAQAKLQAWDKAVTIVYSPDLQQLPQGVDPSTVVVSAYTWVNPVAAGAAPRRPQVRVTLGTKVPDLAGLTREQATQALTVRGLRLRVSPELIQPDWVVQSQRPDPDTIVEFGLTVSGTFGSAEEGLSTTTLVAIAAGSGLGLGLLILVAVLATRRASRRRVPPAAESIEVRAFHGQLVGPELTEPGPGVSLSVRLEPHYDPGTFTLEEGRR